MKTLLLIFLMGMTDGARAAQSADLMLLGVPNQILSFRMKSGYERVGGTNDELVKKENYARFLEQIIREVNQGITGGDALSPDQIKSIALYAQLTVIVRDGYVPSTTRGSSGFEMREVDTMISLYENVLKELIPAIGKHLSLYHKTEKDWDAKKIAAWTNLYKQAIANKAVTPANTNQLMRLKPNHAPTGTNTSH